MARLFVTHEGGGKTPFLRGILTHSLQQAGLSFEDSFEIASAGRAELGSRSKVTRGQIRRAATRHLRRLGKDVAERYASSAGAAPTMYVVLADGQRTPYSRGRHRQSLEACGIELAAATRISAAMYDAFVARRAKDIEIADLKRQTYAELKRHLGDDAARRYAVWEDHRHGDRPLVLLIGGTTRTGKSTVATRAAHLLDIVRTQSTDMLREVMRTIVPQRLVPSLHVSSFRAWETLPVAAREAQGDGLLIEGYLRQAELLAVAGDAVVRRASTERVSVVLEGVHVHPTFLADAGVGTNAHVVRVMLAVLNRTELERRIRGRGRHARERRAKRYMPHFEAICALQDFLLSEADRTGVPMVVNDDVDTAAREVVQIVMRALLAAFDGDEADVLA